MPTIPASCDADGSEFDDGETPCAEGVLDLNRAGVIVSSELMEGACAWEHPLAVLRDCEMRKGAKRLYVMAGRIAVTMVELHWRCQYKRILV